MQLYKGEFRQSLDAGTKAIERLTSEGIPPTPEMYELWYVFYAELNSDVVKELKILSSRPGGISVEVCEALYAKYLSEDKTEAAVKKAGAQIQETIEEISHVVEDVHSRTENYGKTLQRSVQNIQNAKDPAAVQAVLSSLVSDTKTMLDNSSKLKGELDKSSRIIQDLQRDLEQVRREAMTDGLTGLSNRKYFDQEVAKMVHAARHEGLAFTLLMVDIDHFKSFNDNYGHQVGDQVLRLVGRTLVEGIKGKDFAARYGGEEFAILLPETNLAAGVAVGNSVRKAIATKDVINRNSGEKLGRITMSVGVAEYILGESIEDLIERADAALYTAKHNGRNQVAAAPATRRH